MKAARSIVAGLLILAAVSAEAAFTVNDGAATRGTCTALAYDAKTDTLNVTPAGCLGTITLPKAGESIAAFEAYVNARYLTIMGRDADVGGLMFWATYLKSSNDPSLDQHFLDALNATAEAAAYRKAKP